MTCHCERCIAFHKTIMKKPSEIFEDYDTSAFKLTTRMHPLHAPLKCLECGKVIEIGQQYLRKDVYTYHVGCKGGDIL